MNGRTRKGTLLITTQGDQSQVEIAGTPTDIMFNYTALTTQICKTLNLPPLALAGMLPKLVDDYQNHALKYEVKMEGKARADR